MDFQLFKIPVAKQFAAMSQHTLFKVDIGGDELWQAYLDAFPPGSNKVFRERLEYDCSCCRQFIKAVGAVVAIVDNAVVSLWDITSEDPAYQAVADALSALIKSRLITNYYLHTERTAGVDKNFEQVTKLLPDGDANIQLVTWNHFFVHIPKECVAKGVEMGLKLSESRALHNVLERSLQTITMDAVDTVLDLISQGSLYRGSEHTYTLNVFRNLQQAYAATTMEYEAFIWDKLKGLSVAVAKIRNTAIGTLLVDLSEGEMELEQAVRKFEVMVAPANYQRPTALVTKKQIEAARQTLTDLGLVSALERRYARLDDININDILFADRVARNILDCDDVFAELPTKGRARSFDKVEEVTIDDFITQILPRVTSVEVLFENRHGGNLVSLVAPADPTAKRLFKWDNRFSWSYVGDVADSIKERVKKAGGSITGDLLCRLAWFNHDDLDLHMLEPTGYEISFRNRGCWSANGGTLDVDMNAGGGVTREPVENIYYPKRATIGTGVYELFVHNYNKREDTNTGFEVEMDYAGMFHWRLTYEKPVRNGERIQVVQFKYSPAGGVEIISSLPASHISKDVWGLKTQEFRRVNVVMLSPNYWGEQLWSDKDGGKPHANRPLSSSDMPVSGTGNKHYFFMLDGCRNDGSARGFYNEFLHTALTPHRKVLEMVGARMRTDESAHQLSGLGFSSTQRNDLVVRCKGSFTRDIKVVF